MPVKRLPTAEGQLEPALASLEKSDTITHIVSDGPGAVLVFTAPKTTRPKSPRSTASPVKETRG